MDSLLDQSALTSLAERLVAAARRAGADAADAIAERGVSQSVEVRDGTVEESERSEGDNMGLRVLVGRRQAVVSTNDLKGDIDELAARAVAMARVAPEDKFAGLADPDLLVKTVPDLDLLDPQLPSVAHLEETAARRGSRRARRQGRGGSGAPRRRPASAAWC
jgi:PmbA protein